MSVQVKRGTMKTLKEVAGVFICRPTPAVMPTLRLLQQDRGKGMTAVFGYDMKEIPLTQGKIAIVDDDDFEWLNQWRWHYSNGYAVRNVWINGNCKILRMHRIIVGIFYKSGIEIDHIDHDKLNNCRNNLRLCTHSENQHNREMYSNNTSGFKGVSWHKSANKWVARIRINNNLINLGIFNDPYDAACAYDEAARKYHGEFSNPNFSAVECER